MKFKTFSRLHGPQPFHSSTIQLEQESFYNCCIASRDAQTRAQVLLTAWKIRENFFSFLLWPHLNHCWSLIILFCIRQLIIVFLKTFALLFFKRCQFYWYLIIFETVIPLERKIIKDFSSFFFVIPALSGCAKINIGPSSTWASSGRF